MRYRFSHAVLAALLTPALGAAQQTMPGPGDTVRVRVAQQAGWQHGTVERLEPGLLVLSGREGSATVQVAEIERLELRQAQGFNAEAALLWGGIAAAGGATGALLAGGGKLGNFVSPALYFGSYGAALGGGGARARRGMGYGALIGMAPGGLLGLALADGDCSPSDFLCLGPEVWVVSGAAMGAAAGAMVGAWVGALGRRSGWRNVPVHGLAVTPRGDGGVAVVLTHHR